MEPVLRFRLEVPFWCSFRDPTGINVHATFRLPPPTTLYGLIANALGLPQDDYVLRPRLRFAVGIVRYGELVETYSKIMKYSRTEDAARTGSTFGSTTVIKQKLVRPAFEVHVLAEPEQLERVRAALVDPARPLYLGESDDMVDVVNPVIVSATPTRSERFDCAVPGVHQPRGGEPSASVVNLPYHFMRRGKSDWGIQRRLYTYRLDGGPLLLNGALDAHDVDGKHIVFEPPVEEAGA